MDSKAAGLTLSLGIVIAIIGYIMWQSTIGLDTKLDDITTILQNSADGVNILQIATIMVGVGLVVHAVGLLNTRGIAGGNSENLGIFCIITAILIWVTSLSLGLAMAEMGEKYLAALPGAQAGDATAIAIVGSIEVAGGFTQSVQVAANSLAALLAGIGWIFVGIAYKGSEFKGALSFIPLGWLAILQGLILVVAMIVINPLVSLEAGSQISGISFVLIVLWSVSAGLKLYSSSD